MKPSFLVQFLLWLAPLTMTAPALAQDDDEAEDDDRETIADLTENSDRFDGLFTLYRDRDSGETHMAITPEQLDREYIYVAVSTDGVVEGGHFRGNYRENRILSLRRHFDRIEIRAENASFYFDPESPLSRAADANISPGLVASETILAEDEDTGATLIAVDELFASETLSQVKDSPNPDRGDRDGRLPGGARLRRDGSRHREARLPRHRASPARVHDADRLRDRADRTARPRRGRYPEGCPELGGGLRGERTPPDHRVPPPAADGRP